jgi:hypothetical protein
MAYSFLAGFPATARAAFPIIRRGVAEGLSSSVIEQRVRAAGLKISRPRSIDPIRKALIKLEAQGRGVRFVSPANTINVKRLPPALNALNTQYRYRLSVRGTEFGVFDDRGFVSVSTDNPNLTPDMIKDQALDVMKQNPKKYPLDDIEFTVEFGEQRAGIGDFTETRGGNFLMQGGAALNNSGLLGTVLNTTV